MVWKDLPTNYTDAVWDGLKKYKQINNSDGTISFEDVTEYTNKENSFFGAKDANQMNETLNSIYSAVDLISGYNNAGNHNSIYRGKYLGNSITNEQYAHIADGTFLDLYVGDYWTINNVNYRIAAFNYFINTSQNLTYLTTPHVVIVPDSCSMTECQMTDSGSTDGGYYYSTMYQSILTGIANDLNDIFSNHILTHKDYVSYAASNGIVTSVTMVNRTVDLLSQHMVYGSNIFYPISDGTNISCNQTYCKTQLPLFRHEPSLINIKTSYWLRDIVDAESFALVGEDGSASYQLCNDYYGARVYFCLM